jgi:serine/threonine protein kinase
MKLPEAIIILTDAKCPEDVFGMDASGIQDRFRELSKATHPDLNKRDSVRAENAFKKLGEWHRSAEGKVARGTYGQKAAIEAIVITSKTSTYTLDKLIAEGDIANVYSGVNSADKPVLVKICRNPGDNDLLQSEAKILKEMRSGPTQYLKAMAHVPVLLDSFIIQQGPANIQVNVLEYKPNYYTLKQVNEAYPGGIDVRDMAWMWNRMFGAMLMAHQNGYVHASIIPTNFLINPQDHNGILIDWCYAVPIGEKAKLMSPSYKAYYAPEIFSKYPVLEGSDIYMSALNMVKLLGGDEITIGIPNKIPREITGLLRYSMIHSTAHRPKSAFDLHGEFREALRKLYGPPSFREFKMP